MRGYRRAARPPPRRSEEIVALERRSGRRLAGRRQDHHLEAHDQPTVPAPRRTGLSMLAGLPMVSALGRVLGRRLMVEAIGGRVAVHALADALSALGRVHRLPADLDLAAIGERGEAAGELDALRALGD